MSKMFPIVSYFKLKELIILKEILQNRSITAVADMMGIAQPSISRCFSKVREYFQDPLLVRSSKGMVLTPKATEINSILVELFATLEKMENSTFDQTKNAVEFTIAASDYIAQYILSNVLTFLYQDENKISYNIITWNDQSKELLIQGNLHLAISMSPDPSFPLNVYSQLVGEDVLVCVSSSEHPLSFVDELTMNDLLNYNHVFVSTGGGWIERILQDSDIGYTQLNYKLKVDTFRQALEVVQKTNMMTIVPLNVLSKIPGAELLCTYKLPTDIKVAISLWWHERYHNDQAHKWLRKTMFPLIKLQFQERHNNE